MAAQDTQTSLLNTVVQQEMAVRRQRVGISRQDSRLSVKSLIESIEKSQQQVESLQIIKINNVFMLNINFRPSQTVQVPGAVPRRASTHWRRTR